MRHLKTPSQILDDVTNNRKNKGNDITFEHECIIAAQRDALECAAENARVKMSFLNEVTLDSVEVDIQSILNLMPDSL